MIKRAIGILLISLLTGCVTPAENMPPSKVVDEQFLIQDIGVNNYRLTYFAEPETRRAAVEDYLLFRSAEFTLEKGYRNFVLSKEAVDRKPLYEVVSCPVNIDHYSHDLESRYHNFQYYAFGFDWAAPCEASKGDYTPYSAMTYITMVPEADMSAYPNAFTALTVLKNLGPEDCWKNGSHDHTACKLQFP